MKPRILSTLLAITLALFPTLSLVGCGERAIAAENLMANVQPSGATQANEPAPSNPSASEAAALTDFSVRLFQTCAPGDESMLVSPFSVVSALGMVSNGAKGETSTQMESTLGLSAEELNTYLSTYARSLPTEDGCRMDVANSIWIRDIEGFDVNPAFLQTNADFYGAGAYRAPFDDSTLNDINAWTSEHTNGMIPRILDDLPSDSLMCLVNALAFEATWLDEYEDTDVHEATFTCEDGRTKPAQLMYSMEGGFLEDAGATGFIKHYEGARFAFAALLPNEGTSVADYAATLTGDHLRDLLENRSYDVDVDAAVPKFSGDWGTSLSEALAGLGMPNAFDDRADFSGIAGEPGDLFIGDVIHKTHVEVDEHGTKAAAATALMMDAASAMPEEREVKVVHLDRPFIYAIIDCDTNIPIFLGTVMDI